jgi:protein-L-isoaspartate(D-aspartate) O-methyltransferase
LNSDAELAVVRRAFAKHVLFVAGVSGNQDVEDAFAEIRREHYLGAGPWWIFRGRRYQQTPDADPVYLYSNDPVAIDASRRLNNGQPSLHAILLAAAKPGPGDHVVHVGAGVGYVTALLAHLVGKEGRVTAIEIESELAERARQNLAGFDTVEVQLGDGFAIPFDQADLIYVNAGATGPPAAWLDRLADGGRMIIPLTTDQGFRAGEPAKVASRGVVFRICRRGADYDARLVSSIEIYPCAGARGEEEERALAAALARELPMRVTRFYRGGDIPEELCWLRGEDWCFASEHPADDARPPKLPSAAPWPGSRANPRGR